MLADLFSIARIVRVRSVHHVGVADVLECVVVCVFLAWNRLFWNGTVAIWATVDNMLTVCVDLISHSFRLATLNCSIEDNLCVFVLYVRFCVCIGCCLSYKPSHPEMCGILLPIWMSHTQGMSERNHPKLPNIGCSLVFS